MLIAGSVDLGNVLMRLATHRPVFHSEADFQHALAWAIHEEDPLMKVYLETRPAEGVRLDLAFERPDLERYTAIELKYLTRFWAGEVSGQHYDLKNHSAHDLRRYDVVKDIERVERFIQGRPRANGAVVVLSNDPAYWKKNESVNASDLAFRIGEGAVLKGEMHWGRIPASTERQPHLTLTRPYEMSWTDFSPSDKEPQLRQLVIEIPAPSDRNQ